MTEEFHLKNNIVDRIRVKLSPEVFDKRFQKAQFWLDSAIAQSMLPYIPYDTGTLQEAIMRESMAVAGTGRVCAYTLPYGRYLYEGVKMVDSKTGKGARKFEVNGQTIFRYRLGATLVPTAEPLHYSNPQATPKWFETAKNNHSKDWVKGVKNILNGRAELTK